MGLSILVSFLGFTFEELVLHFITLINEIRTL